jgi:hypothetical protein
MAGVAADPVIELGLVRNPSPLVHAILALNLLLAAAVLGIYKPFGMTAYGTRGHEQQRETVASVSVPLPGTPRWIRVFAVIALGIMLLVVLMHLIGNSLQH